jgi:DNA-binding MarR family transcriptional regulator
VPTKTILLSHEDLSSLQRVLSSLSDSGLGDAGFGDSGLGGSGGDPATSADVNIPRAQLHNIARTLMFLRKRRADYLYRAMLGEPAYDMLLGLYVAEGDRQLVTAARLADIACVAQSSAARWIEYLVTKDLIERERHPTHKRASILKLSRKGRDALDRMFASAIEAVRDLAI